MTPESRLGKFGVALLAPRMCILGEDPCGGSEVVLWEDAEILKKAGIAVRVYGRAARDGAPVRVIALRTNAPLITSMEYCGQFLWREPRAAVISYNEPSVAGWVPDRTIARFDWSTALPKYWSWPVWRRRFERAIYLFPSSSQREIFFHYYPSMPRRSMSVLPNAVDLELFKPVANGEDKRLRVGFAGQWVPGKGITELLEAWRKVKSDLPHAVLYLAGGASLWQNVQKTSQADEAAGPVCQMEVEGLLHCVGALPRQRMPEFWNSVSMAVVPSREESFGLVALEALACGVPVVASTAGGLKEIVEDGKSGLLVPPGDSAALFQALRKLLTDEALRLRLAEGARRRAQQFSMERRAATLLDLLEKRT